MVGGGVKFLAQFVDPSQVGVVAGELVSRAQRLDEMGLDDSARTRRCLGQVAVGQIRQAEQRGVEIVPP